MPFTLDTYLEGINNVGEIVGWYDDSHHIGHGFPANPVPEPNPLLLLAIGTLGVIGWARRPKGRECVVALRYSDGPASSVLVVVRAPSPARSARVS